MIIEIKKDATDSEIKAALDKAKGLRKKKKLVKYFGKLKLEVDGLEFQKQVRNEWD